MRRPLAVVATIALASCGGAKDSAPDPATMIDCAMKGAESFARNCWVETVASEKGDGLIIRHNDGGFRRFLIEADNTGLSAADGSFPAVNSVVGDQLEVRVRDDRYRLPAALDQIGGI